MQKTSNIERRTLNAELSFNPKPWENAISSSVPEGQIENSPAFQRRVCGEIRWSPEGTAEPKSGSFPQPSLRDSIRLMLEPSVKTLGYYRLSLRDNEKPARISSILFFCLFLFVTGCETKRQANRKAQAAYIAGQQQAIQMQQSVGQNIQISGEVRNETVEWTEGMSLTQAIVAAEYLSARDPIEILIIRRGHVIPVNPKELLRGRDHLLEPGDRIQLRR